MEHYTRFANGFSKKTDNHIFMPSLSFVLHN